MPNPYLQDQIENWVSDFVVSDQLRPFSPPLREIAGDLLVAFLAGACAVRDVEPGDLEEPDLKTALLTKVSRLAIPENARPEVPGACGALLAFLESEGRLSGGRALGAFVKALKEAYLDASATKARPITNVASKIGRNDPCPCGSGKKFKKCCMGEKGIGD